MLVRPARAARAPEQGRTSRLEPSQEATRGTRRAAQLHEQRKDFTFSGAGSNLTIEGQRDADSIPEILLRPCALTAFGRERCAPIGYVLVAWKDADVKGRASRRQQMPSRCSSLKRSPASQLFPSRDLH